MLCCHRADVCRDLAEIDVTWMTPPTPTNVRPEHRRDARDAAAEGSAANTGWFTVGQPHEISWSLIAGHIEVAPMK